MIDRIFITNKNLAMGFGRYPNATIADVLHDDPHYLVWCQENIDWFDLHHTILEEAEGADQDYSRYR
jgi:hypothetical protein